MSTDGSNGPELFAFHESLFTERSVAIGFLGPDLRYRRVNDALALLTGTTAAAHVGRSIVEVMGPTGEPLAHVARRVLVSGEAVQSVRVEASVVSRTHTTGCWMANVFPVRDGDAIVGVGCMLWGIADGPAGASDAEAHGALERRERYFRSLVEHSADGIALIAPDSTILRATSGFERLLGYPPSEHEGMNGVSLVHEDDRPMVETKLAGLIGVAGASEFVRCRVRHRDGEYRTIECTLTNLLDNPDVRAVVSNFRDVTDRQSLQDQLAHVQKLESIGRLAGGVAHDFNNLLTVILGHSSFARLKLADGESVDAEVDQIEEAARRAAHLTRQLLSFARREIIEPRTLDLNDLVRDIEGMMARLLGDDIELTTRLTSQSSAVRLDPMQFQQVLLNLAVNARDAMPTGGVLSLETRRQVVDAQDAARYHELEPGEYLVLTVADTGVGIAPEIQDRVFEPFFTTKSRGAGTGLGLSTCYGIVRQNRGHIWFTSQRGQGTRFTVFLPCARSEATPARSGSARKVSATGSDTAARGERVLLVEDEPVVRRLQAEALRASGYDVLEARDGRDALRVAQEHADSIDLLVTDVVMPHVSGRQLAQEMRRGRDGLQVIYISGYIETSLASECGPSTGLHYLEKPFMPLVLVRKVRQVLDRKAA